MIKISAVIKNPWFKENFYSFFCKSGSFTKHKHWEIQVCRYSYELALLSIDTCFFGEDHAGPELEIGLLGYSIRFKIYDSRHWDYENGRWQIYKDEEHEHNHELV